MRSSNSRDKASTTLTNQTQQSKMLKTQVPPKVPQKQSLNSTQYKLPPSNKRIQSSKNLQSTSKPMPIQQVDFDIQKHMTQSKIFAAKQSLQLLKKKMNRTGMSRQKPTSSNQNINLTNTTVSQRNIQNQKQQPSIKKIKSTQPQKNIENYEPTNYQYQEKVTPTYNKNKYYQEPLNNKTQTKKVQEKNIARKIQPLPKQQKYQKNYQNQHQEVPITQKQDFFALLQKQMQKQANKSNVVTKNNFKNSYSKQPVISNQMDDQNIELIQCSKGCGRQFNSNAIAKHQKICQKVFQSKRKVFDASAHRALETEGFQKPPQMTSKMNQTKKQPQKKPNKIPKWKMQSAELRAGLKAVSNKPLTQEEQTLTNMQKDSLVQCNYCNRRFSDQAAKRHIPFCEAKAKKSSINSRPSNTKKR